MEDLKIKVTTKELKNIMYSGRIIQKSTQYNKKKLVNKFKGYTVLKKFSKVNFIIGFNKISCSADFISCSRKFELIGEQIKEVYIIRVRNFQTIML